MAPADGINRVRLSARDESKRPATTRLRVSLCVEITALPAAHLEAALDDGLLLPVPVAAVGGQADDVFDAGVAGAGDGHRD